MNRGKQGKQDPSLLWKNELLVVELPDEDGGVINAQWKPGLTYVVRVRRKGAVGWSVGFETPLRSAKIVDLEPNKEYEMSVTAKNEAGESEPSIVAVVTNSAGEASN